MANFWDNLGGKKPQQNNGFNIQEFMKFAQQMKGKDPNQMLQQMMENSKENCYDDARNEALI